MPIYVYKCPKCDSTQEQLHGMEEIPSISCTLGCKDVYCTKLVYGPRQFVLKGEGFHVKGPQAHGYPKRS